MADFSLCHMRGQHCGRNGCSRINFVFLTLNWRAWIRGCGCVCVCDKALAQRITNGEYNLNKRSDFHDVETMQYMASVCVCVCVCV